MNPKIIFLDLDGTLLSDKKSVSQYDVDTLWKCSRNGIRIGYVTSRTERKIKELTQGLPCDFIASLNGSHIQIFENGKTVWQEIDGIAWNIGKQLLERLMTEMPAKVAANFWPYSLWNGTVSRDGVALGNWSEFVNQIAPVRFQRIRLYNLGKVPTPMEAGLRQVLEGTDILIESSAVHKGTASHRIMAYYGFRSEDAVAFGDGELDIPMFQACGCGVAMRNSPPSVCAAATEISESNNDSGVGKWIQRKCFSEHQNHICGSLGDDNCIYLLKDLRGIVTPVPAQEKRRLLKEGKPGHSILAEDPPISHPENALFLKLLEEKRVDIANCVGVLCESILAQKQGFPVIVSLARGGIAYGALCRQYYKKFYHADIPHYCISLIRNVGIDENALNYIVRRHGDKSIQFIDGWTGSGFLSAQLEKYVSLYNQKHGTKISAMLAVLADTSHICQLSGTRKDILLPDCCLNSTVCGLISSVYYDPAVIGPEDFHGAVVWDSLISQDFSRYFLETVTASLVKQQPKSEKVTGNYGREVSQRLSAELMIDDSKRIRLGIGESTRALFRSDISRILSADPSDPRLTFLAKLASSKGVRIEQYNTGEYACVTILAGR